MINLKLSKYVFTEAHILYVQKLYNKIADISIENNAEYWILEFSNCRLDENITVKEFENYLIGMENT